jgi:uncharacterized membrane protein
MFRPLPALTPTGLGKWCAYALVLLAPGSFIALPVLWLVRHFAFAPRHAVESQGDRAHETRDL